MLAECANLVRTREHPSQSFAPLFRQTCHRYQNESGHELCCSRRRPRCHHMFPVLTVVDLAYVEEEDWGGRVASNRELPMPFRAVTKEEEVVVESTEPAPET